MSHDGYVVPYTVTEWNRVRSLFRSKNDEELEECLAILSMWRSRMGDNTPVAISCSDLIIRVQVEENQTEATPAETRWMRLEGLKMHHCIALIRFINYVNEICQTDKNLMSMARAVKQVGIPAWLVEIRHNASHAHVPPIDTLRMAFEYSRKWLWDNFWDRPPDEAMTMAGYVRGQDEHNELLSQQKDEKMRNIIAEYIRWRGVVRVYTPEVADSSPQIRAMRTLILHEPYDFIRTFVSDGMLIMNMDQLVFSRVVPKGDTWVIPHVLEKFWEPVITFLHENKVIGELLISLLARLAPSSHGPLEKHVEAQVVAWSRGILEPFVDNDVMFSRMEWTRILHRLVAAPGYFDAELLEKVMTRIPNLSDKRKRQVKRVMNITLSESMEAVEDSMSVRTVEDLQKMIKRDLKRGRVVESADDRFGTCDEDEWNSIPIGLCPGQTHDTLTLIIDDDWIRRHERRKRAGELSIILE